MDTGRGRASGGLGLAIARRIVEDHDGAIVVEDGERGGACFEIRLPRSG